MKIDKSMLPVNIFLGLAIVLSALIFSYMIGDIARSSDGCKFNTRAEYLILPYSFGCWLTEPLGE